MAETTTRAPNRPSRDSRSLEALIDDASRFEFAPPELSLEIARAYYRVGAYDDALNWLRRATEVGDSFRAWTAAAKMLSRLRSSAGAGSGPTKVVAIVGSYTTSQLAGMLPVAALPLGIDVDVREGLFSQYQQDVLDGASPLYRAEPDDILFAVHEGAAQFPVRSTHPAGDVAAEAARWRNLWSRAVERSGAGVVQHLFAIRPESALGHLSAGDPSSRHAMLQSLNRELAQAAPPEVSVVDCDRVAAAFGRDRWFDDRYWFWAKQAMSLDAVPLLARHTAAVLASRWGRSRKCLVLDIDNTLWGGVVGEDGIDGVRLGGDAVGEAFVAFQEAILALRERGVLLAVASKNNDADAREMFERHPEMRIRLHDIAAWAVTWEDKPASLRRIADTLGIGVDSLVLVDDNPAERQAVRRLVPEVDVIPLPEDPAGYRRALSEYLGFEAASITTEDRERTAQYRALAAARELASSAADMATFYRDLRMEAKVAPFDARSLPRVAQLVAKTNQFNLTTRRHGIAQLDAFSRSAAHITRSLRLRDRFSDHGLVAVLIAEQVDLTLRIDTFLMSCRVIGRTVEAHLLMHATREAKARGCLRVVGTYIPSPRNEVVADLYGRFGFRRLTEGNDGSSEWEYDLSKSGVISSDFVRDAEAG